MKFLIIPVLLFITAIGIACCKVSGDSEEDAQRCFENWVNEKNGKNILKTSEGGLE